MDSRVAEDEWDEGGGARLSFDIYLKGNVARGAASFFRAAPHAEGRGFRMFPYVEKRRRIDDYGEVLDVGAWVRRGKIMEEAENERLQEEMKMMQAHLSTDLENRSKLEFPVNLANRIRGKIHAHIEIQYVVVRI